jgi:hypothetical protein
MKLDSVVPYLGEGNQSFSDVDQMTSAAIYHIRLFSMFSILGDKLKYWVKLRTITWFPQSLLEQYNDDHSLMNFKMTKRIVFTPAEILQPQFQKELI